MKQRSTAFTLIELLVVIAIIAVLAAILFPVFAQAKSAAKKTQSIAQIRQISTAWLMYNADSEGSVMRVATRQPGKVFYWWGSWDGTTLRESEGLLFPYMKNGQIQTDPLFPNRLRSVLGLTGYGYNYAYLSPSSYPAPTYQEVPIPVNEAQIEQPADTLLFASAARINNWAYAQPTLEGNTYIDPPSFDFPSIHGRANGQAVIAWTDGHVSSRKPSLRTADFGFGNSAARFRQENLGDVLRSGCPAGSPCQDYFYALAKPTAP